MHAVFECIIYYFQFIIIIIIIIHEFHGDKSLKQNFRLQRNCCAADKQLTLDAHRVTLSMSNVSDEITAALSNALLVFQSQKHLERISIVFCYSGPGGCYNACFKKLVFLRVFVFLRRDETASSCLL